jgi:assimilatory nitrate reductase catalytic subunit
VLRYQDAAARGPRPARDADGRTQLQAFWLAGDTGGEAWLRQLLEADTPARPGPPAAGPGELARALGEAATPASPQVCTCFNVREDAIRQTLAAAPAAEERLAALTATLRCGSNCGSCIPALRGLVKAVPLAPRAVAA